MYSSRLSWRSALDCRAFREGGGFLAVSGLLDLDRCLLVGSGEFDRLIGRPRCGGTVNS
jgi:hypothetical protein